MKYSENTRDLDARIRAHKLFSRTTLESILEGTLAGFPLTDAPLLDLGCGNGNYFPIFRRGARPYVGLDVSRELLHAFGERFTEDKVLIRASMDELPDFMDETFAAILSVYSIYYTDNAQNLIKELHRMLKRDGLLVLVGPQRKVHAPEIATGLAWVAAQGRHMAAGVPAAIRARGWTAFMPRSFRPCLRRSER